MRGTFLWFTAKTAVDDDVYVGLWLLQLRGLSCGFEASSGIREAGLWLCQSGGFLLSPLSVWVTAKLALPPTLGSVQLQMWPFKRLQITCAGRGRQCRSTPLCDNPNIGATRTWQCNCRGPINTVSGLGKASPAGSQHNIVMLCSLTASK